MVLSAYFAQGLALGFGSGMAPGPFLALVISSTLRGGFRHGALVALAPLITDAPIIIACLLLLSELPAGAVGVLSLLGAAVLVWYAYEAFRDARTTSLSGLREDASRAPAAAAALRRGVAANLLNPNPWMFWITIGGPLLTAAWAEGPLQAGAFLLPFYALLIGSKVLIAGALGAGRDRLGDTGYRGLLIAAGLLLLGLALALLRSGAAAIAGG